MRTLPLLVLLFIAGCQWATVPSPSTPERTAAELAGSLWTVGAEEWRIRQSALFELGPARVPMGGFLLLHPGEARLVGLDDLGVKLFDLLVTPGGHIEHFLHPELARLPGVGGAIAASVRRIFLAPRPAPGDRLRPGRDGLRLDRFAAWGDVHFLFSGADADLQETRVRGDGEDWRVRYYDYRAEGEYRIPGRIVLDDFGGDYRLTLWLEEARRS